MQLEVNDEFRFVSIWLTNEEEAEKDQYIQELQEQIDDYRARKYKFVIYYSGTGDLLQLTGDLLSHNKNLMNQEKNVEKSETSCYNVVNKRNKDTDNIVKEARRGKKIR